MRGQTSLERVRQLLRDAIQWLRDRAGSKAVGELGEAGHRPVNDDGFVGDIGLYERGRRQPGGLPIQRAAEVARGTEGFVWVGLQEPSLGEVEAIAGQFDLPALAVEDAVKAHQRPKLEVYDDILFAVSNPYATSTLTRSSI